jgi:hypothetical protein
MINLDAYNKSHTSVYDSLCRETRPHASMEYLDRYVMHFSG